MHDFDVGLVDAGLVAETDRLCGQSVVDRRLLQPSWKRLRPSIVETANCGKFSSAEAHV